MEFLRSLKYLLIAMFVLSLGYLLAGHELIPHLYLLATIGIVFVGFYIYSKWVTKKWGEDRKRFILFAFMCGLILMIKPIYEVTTAAFHGKKEVFVVVSQNFGERGKQVEFMMPYGVDSNKSIPPNYRYRSRTEIVEILDDGSEIVRSAGVVFKDLEVVTMINNQSLFWFKDDSLGLSDQAKTSISRGEPVGVYFHGDYYKMYNFIKKIICTDEITDAKGETLPVCTWAQYNFIDIDNGGLPVYISAPLKWLGVVISFITFIYFFVKYTRKFCGQFYVRKIEPTLKIVCVAIMKPFVWFSNLLKNK